MQMRACTTGVEQWQVLSGREPVDVRYAVADPPSGQSSAILVWGAGFGQPFVAVEKSANILAQKSGLQVVSIQEAMSQVACAAGSAKDVSSALADFIQTVPYFLAHKFGPGLSVYLGGHSLNGGAMALASGSGECKALGLLSPSSLNNAALGSKLFWRQLAVFNRLVIQTGLQNWHDPAMYRTLGTGVANLIKLAARGRFNPAFEHGFGDATEEHILANLAALTRTEIPWYIFDGDQERCFRRTEHLSTLGRIGCTESVIKQVKGPHACMDGKGQHQLVVVGEWFGSLATTA